MSRGFGLVEQWLLTRIGAEPMTFEQILDAAYPPGSFENDMAKTIGASQVGRVRSTASRIVQALRSRNYPEAWNQNTPQLSPAPDIHQGSEAA
jgi:hypothetical protein